MSSRDSLPRHRPLFLPCESGQRLARADCWAVVPATATGGDLDFYPTLATWGATQDKTVASSRRTTGRGPLHLQNNQLNAVWQHRDRESKYFQHNFFICEYNRLQISSVQLKTTSQALKMRQFETIAYRPQGRYLVY